MTTNEELNSIKKNPAVLRVYGNKTKLEKQGKDWFGRCPIHRESTPSFSISMDGQGNWLYHCFGCGAGGDVLDFVQKTDNVNFAEAVKRVKEIIGASDWEETSHVDKVFKPLETPKTYKTFTLEQYKKLEDALAESEAGKAWLLNERGITYETAKKLHIGFRQDLGKIAGVPNQDVADKGWVSFPCIEDGAVVSIKYRSIAKKSFSRQPGMKTTLMGLDEIDIFEPVWVVEGEIDRLSVVQAGKRAVSLPNANYNLTPEERTALLQAESIILAGDNDGTVGTKAMERLKLDFGDRAVLVKWENGKDANEVFVKHCQKDLDRFRVLLDNSVKEARSQPLPGVYSLVDVMRSGKNETLVDHPDRFKFPWKQVDQMAVLVPGAVVFSTATKTGTGKTVFWMNATVHAARKNNQCVLNYQCELSEEEFAVATAAHLVLKDRNELSREDRENAAKLLNGVRYYVGSDPTLDRIDPVLDLIEAAVKRLGITVVVLDHLNFLCRNEPDEYKAQAKAMQRIKLMARTYGLIFIVIGQPRKPSQQGKNQDLDITDAKGSSSQGDDADAVYFLNRNVIKNIDPSNPPMDEYEPETEVRLKKGRSKGKGSAYAKLYYEGKCATFVPLDVVHEES